VASVDNQADAQETQADFPHLTIVADPERSLCTAFQVIHAGAGPNKEDIAGPTTFLIDRAGAVRWVFRPDRFISRLTPAQLLAAVDEHLSK
jgi:peroxiredoxin